MTDNDMDEMRMRNESKPYDDLDIEKDIVFRFKPKSRQRMKLVKPEYFLKLEKAGITVEALLWYIQMFTWHPTACKRFKPMPSRCRPFPGQGTEEDWVKEIVDALQEEKQKLIDEGFEELPIE